MRKLEGKVAIVTGAGRGLGRSHALELARQGANVIVNDLGTASFTGGGQADTAPAQEVVDAIVAAGGRAAANANDIADWNGTGDLVDFALSTFGRLDIVVNNAAISRFGKIDEITQDDWEQTIRVNLTGTAAMCHWAAVHWRKAGPEGGRRIVNTSSGVGLAPVQGNPMYVASKSAVASLTTACAEELAGLGVRANAIAPVARTRISEFVAGDAVKPRQGQFDTMNPDNVAAVVAYLASPDCPFTGRVFGVIGSHLALYEPWNVGQFFDNQEQRWTHEALHAALSAVPLQIRGTGQSIPGAIPIVVPTDATLEALRTFDP